MAYASRVFALLLAVILGTASTALAAKEMKFKEFPFDISKGERLIVQGVRGSVRLIPLAAGKGPVVRARKVLQDAGRNGGAERFDALSFQVRREAGAVIVEIKGPNSRQEWIDWSRPGQPEIAFEIEAPSTPTEVYLHSGSVTATGWKDFVAASLQEGRITLTDGDGGVRAAVMRGDVKIDKQKGSIEVESHAARVSVTNSVGRLQVHCFAGETTVSTLKGNLSVRSKTGGVTLAKIEGDLDFDNGRGRFDASAIEGAVRGVNDEGTVSLQLTGEADVSIETQDGSVAVKPPGGAGVLLKLSTEDGFFVAPDSVQVPKNTGPKSLVARLDGAPRGLIAVRSKRGTIRVR